METYAVVPARAGSKRIPGKNMRMFFGKPIIQWVLENLRDMRCFDRVVVSTENMETADFVRNQGFEAPFTRPKSLAGDHTPTSEVVSHAIEWLLENGASEKSEFLTVYPTAVMVTPHHINSARKLLQLGQCNFVFAGAKMPAAFERSWKRTLAGTMQPVSPEKQNSRTQDVAEDLFYDLGQFYWSTATSWNGTEESPQLRMMLELSPLEVVDIDTEEDWRLAERLFLVNRR